MSRNDDEVLSILFSALPGGIAQLNAAMEQLREELTPALGEKALAQFALALSRQELEKALLSATLASRIFYSIGKPEESLKAYLDFLGVRFLTDKTEDDYARTLGALRDALGGNPRGIGPAPIGLSALSLAADCAYFACEAAAEDANKKHWLSRALQSLQFGAEYLGKVDKTDHNVGRYISVLAAVYQRLVQCGWTGEPWATTILASLAVEVDKAVPEKVTYIDDHVKTEQINALRVQLSAAYDQGAFTGTLVLSSNQSGLFWRKQIS